MSMASLSRVTLCLALLTLPSMLAVSMCWPFHTHSCIRLASEGSVDVLNSLLSV